jgi:hypothetical protein
VARISKKLQARLKRAVELLAALEKFVTSGPLRDSYREEKKKCSEVIGQVDSGTLLDWFLFEWVDENGLGAIDHFLGSQTDISHEDRSILLDWMDSIDSVFEIKSVGGRSIRVRDLEDDQVLDVLTEFPTSELPFRRGHFIAARLLPFEDKFIFSKELYLLPDREAALEAHKLNRALDDLFYSPEAVEAARRREREAFGELFGSDQISLAPAKLKATLDRFYRYLFFERVDPEIGMTVAEKFRSLTGRELKLPPLPPLPSLKTDMREITLLCDEFDGIVPLPDYKAFKRIFEVRDPDKELPGWRELAWRYVKDPEIPIVAFERIAERHPRRVEKVMRQLIGDDGFSIDHLYATLLHYKEPVEGLDSLEEECKLWDLFDGKLSGRPSKAGRREEASPKR